MALYVTRVPDPDVGTDWLTTVPGQWIYNITSVSATLTAQAGQPTIAVDSSGHGNDGTYRSFFQPITFVPGLIPGDLALFTGPNANAAVAGVNVPMGVLDWHNPFTYAMWIKETPTLNNPWLIFQSRDNFDNGVVTIVWDEFGGNLIKVGGDVLTVWESPVNTLPDDGSVHFLVLVWDGAALTLWMDGVVVPWAVTGSLPAFTHFTFAGGIAVDSINNTAGAGIFDEVALYNYDLSAGDIATLMAASGSFAAYSAAVLATSPVSYYHLNDEITAAGRQVALEITDGTHTVDLLPTGFAESPTPGTYKYTWRTNAPSNTQSPNQLITTVGIPRLVLPPGYTIGAHTLDLGSADQWSEVGVWWNSDVMDAERPIEPYAYPPGALLAWRGHREA